MDKAGKIRRLLLLQERVKRLAEVDLHVFLEHYAWPVLQPGNKFVDNWHIHVICEHLEAVSSGQVKRLVINLPYRMLKSTIVSQAFPAWEWICRPHLQYLTASYAKDVATRDAVDSRKIIESQLYQDAWGGTFKLTSDQNVKTRYENDKKGGRVVTATNAAGTGFGGNRIIVDDPVSVQEADSDVARAASIEWWKGTASTRLNNPADDAIVVVHQRLNRDDLTGYLLSEEKGWEHLVLPMRYDPALRKTTSLGFMDPRAKPGELLSPGRLPEASVAEMEARLGSYHTAAQLQQNPDSRGGGLFKLEHIKLWPKTKKLPPLHFVLQSYDTAFTDNTANDPTACLVLGVFEEPNKTFSALLLDAWDEHLAYPTLRKKVIADWGKKYGARKDDPTNPGRRPDVVLVEEKGSGISILQDLRKARVPARVYNPGQASKTSRASQVLPMYELGMLYIPETLSTPAPGVPLELQVFEPWARAFVKQLLGFGFGSTGHDDYVDTLTQALIYLRNEGWLALPVADDSDDDEQDYSRKKINPYD